LLVAATFVSGTVGLSSAAVAAPYDPPATPPNSGARPTPNGPMALPSAGIPGQPGSGATSRAISADPVMAKIAQEQQAVEALAERLNEAGEALVEVSTKHAEATVALDEAAAVLAEKQTAADEWARKTYIDAATHPNGLPLVPLPGRGTLPGSRIVDTPLSELAAAQEAYDRALEVERSAADTEAAQQRTVDGLRTQLDSRGAALNTLRTAYASAISTAEQRRNAENDKISAQYLNDAGGQAGPQALKAVQYALAQLGKPYEWAAEGPDSFDCSGLVQSAYRFAGVSLPRTARPQFRATKPVTINALLPGDLLFFATNKSDWNTIHHVAIYLGKGKMLHAPTFGQNVKISPIWWAEFFAATRVVPGKIAPVPTTPATTTPKPTPSPTSGPKPTPPPTGSPTPSPTGSPSPSPTGSPTPSPTTSPSPSPTTSPAPAPTASPSPSPTTAPAPTDSAETPTPSPSPAPTDSAETPSSSTTESTASTSSSPTESPSPTASGGG
jgi:cell wall-associated NlpC family hydrolase